MSQNNKNNKPTTFFDKAFLKQLRVLYVEDDPNIREKLLPVLESLFKEALGCADGLDGLETFENSKNGKNKIDIIISDINMPKMDGLEMLKNIREVDSEIPFIFTTAYSDSKYTMEAIKLGVSHYIVKPLNAKELLMHVQEICKVKYQQKIVEHSRIELERYIDVVNQVAIISKTDPKGIITFVNDIFCEISKYSREELIGQNQNIVRHPDMPSIAFKGLWEDIRAGLSWKGKIKNKDKDGEAYYVNSNVFPIYDDFDEEIVEYVGIRFLTTEEETEKREFKKKVIQTYQESKRRDIVARTKIDQLEEQLVKYENFDIIVDTLERTKESNKKLNQQLKHYEDEIVVVREKSESTISDSFKRIEESIVRQREAEGDTQKVKKHFVALHKKYTEMEEECKKQIKIVEEQIKTISDLREVIEHREDEIIGLK